jgi:GPN-loop GTPase
MGYALFVFGPAGVGKSTFCRNVLEHGRATGRSYKIVNLDPAQALENDEYTVDLREHITVSEIMENADCGPNGGLILALEELHENMDALELEELEDSYLIFDCPGQIELFMHSDIMPRITAYVQQYFRCAVVYLMEAQYLSDINKYLHGCLCALISMSRFTVPCINVISKMDQAEDEDLDLFCAPTDELYRLIGEGPYAKLGGRMLEFIIENNMLRFHPLDYSKEDTLIDILWQVDNALQYYEDLEPKEIDE